MLIPVELSTLDLMRALDDAHAILYHAKSDTCSGTSPQFLKVYHALEYLDRVARETAAGILSPPE